MLSDAIVSRRSIRQYQPRPVEKEKIAQLLEAGLRAPSSRALFPWEFLVVDRPELLRQMVAMRQIGSAFIGAAPLAIVVCADAGQSDTWIEDSAIAAAFMTLAAETLGLGSCWIQIRGRESAAGKSSETFLRELLHIPDRLTVLWRRVIRPSRSGRGRLRRCRSRRCIIIPFK